MVGASHANLRQTMHQPSEQPALFPLFPLLRTFRAEREKHERPGSRIPQIWIYRPSLKVETQAAPASMPGPGALLHRFHPGY